MGEKAAFDVQGTCFDRSTLTACLSGLLQGWVAGRGVPPNGVVPDPRVLLARFKEGSLEKAGLGIPTAAMPFPTHLAARTLWDRRHARLYACNEARMPKRARQGDTHDAYLDGELKGRTLRIQTPDGAHIGEDETPMRGHAGSSSVYSGYGSCAFDAFLQLHEGTPRAFEGGTTARIAVNLTWITRWLTGHFAPLGRSRIEEPEVPLVGAAWMIFVAWKYRPGAGRPHLLELTHDDKGVAHVAAHHATHGPWNGTTICVCTGRLHTEPVWWRISPRSFTPFAGKVSGLPLLACDGLHDLTKFALYYLLTPVRLVLQDEEPLTPADRELESELRSGWADLELGGARPRRAHALEAGAVDRGHITVVSINGRYPLVGIDGAPPTPPAHLVYGGTAEGHCTRLILQGSALLWAVWDGEAKDERCLSAGAKALAAPGGRGPR